MAMWHCLQPLFQKQNKKMIVRIFSTDFLGFDEYNEAFRSITCDDILSSTLNTSTTLPPTPNRTISRDSGIGLTSLSDSQITNMSTIEESDGAITIEISTEDSGIATSTGPETSVNQDISIALDGSEIVKVIPASNDIDRICEGDSVDKANVTISLENGRLSFPGQYILEKCKRFLLQQVQAIKLVKQLKGMKQVPRRNG